ncbi:hypothetical protein PHMEG_00021353, partial [Phytophthora megakarya]
GELRQSNLARDRLVRDGDHLDRQVRQLRSDIRDMEEFQHGQGDEITRLEAVISTLTHDAGDDPEVLRAQVLQLRTERNDFERHTISAREDLHHAEADRDRLRQEAIQADDEIRDLQEQVRVSERDQVRLDLCTARAAQLNDDLEVVRLELQGWEGRMADLQLAHDQLVELRDLAESDLAEADLLLTHLASRIRESQAARMPKRGGSPGGGSPLQLNPPLFPAEVSVPLYSTVKIFTTAEITPWDPVFVGTVPIVANDRGYFDQKLITGAKVLALMATEPWRMLGQNRPTPLTFDHNLHRRADTPLWRIAVSYAALEEDHLIAYWESTHYLEITNVTAAADPDLFIYHQDRRQRRIRVGESWRKLLGGGAS